MNPNTKKLIGALVAAALAIAVYYGAISQQSANSIQTQTNQSLGTTPAQQQVGPQSTQNPPATQPPGSAPQQPTAAPQNNTNSQH